MMMMMMMEVIKMELWSGHEVKSPNTIAPQGDLLKMFVLNRPGGNVVPAHGALLWKKEG